MVFTSYLCISWVLTSPPPLPSLNTPSILGSRAGLKGGESVGVKGTGTGERRAGKNWFSSGPCGAVCSPALCERARLTERHSVWGNLQFLCRSLLVKSKLNYTSSNSLTNLSLLPQQKAKGIVYCIHWVDPGFSNPLKWLWMIGEIDAGWDSLLADWSSPTTWWGSLGCHRNVWHSNLLVQ